MGAAVKISLRVRVAAAAAGAVLLPSCAADAQMPAPKPNPLAGIHLYLDPGGHAAADRAGLKRSGNQAAAARLSAIADQPAARWLTGAADDPDVAARIVQAAVEEGTVPVFVLYNLPLRDAGSGHSAGGAKDAAAYTAWAVRIAHVLDSHRAIVIVEPDGVAAVADHRLAGDAAAERLATLKKTVTTLAANPDLFVYLDAGNPGWSAPKDMAGLLAAAGVGQARGISVNVANFYSDQDSASYGSAIAAVTGGGGVIVDSSRNGSGPASPDKLSWCNPKGRTLGRVPAIAPDGAPVQAWLWIKQPGDSDGTCRPGEPAAGQWWREYALGLTTGK